MAIPLKDIIDYGWDHITVGNKKKAKEYKKIYPQLKIKINPDCPPGTVYFTTEQIPMDKSNEKKFAKIENLYVKKTKTVKKAKS